MNLTHLKNEILLKNIENLVKTEQTCTVKILKHLVEFDNRKLFVELGYSSLYSYCKDHLKYSEQEATIRVNAARLIKNSALAETKIENKELTLTVAADLFASIKKFNQVSDKKLDKLEKDKLINQVSNLSTRNAKKIIQETLNLPVEVKTDIKLKAKTVERLNKLKEKLNINDIDQLLNYLMQEKEDQLVQGKTSVNSLQSTSAPVSASPSKPSRYIPLKLKRELRQRANYQCEFINHDHKRCEARTFLQVEHSIPFSFGGGNDQENLKIYCREHNQYAGIKNLGVTKMNAYSNQRI